MINCTIVTKINTTEVALIIAKCRIIYFRLRHSNKFSSSRDVHISLTVLIELIYIINIVLSEIYYLLLVLSW